MVGCVITAADGEIIADGYHRRWGESHAEDAALAAALAGHRIAAAGLDVYENEPALNQALLEAPNIVLTPHIGSGTRSSRLGMAMLAARNLLAIEAGEPALTPLNAGALKASR